jgi:hypothetical protein
MTGAPSGGLQEFLPGEWDPTRKMQRRQLAQKSRNLASVNRQAQQARGLGQDFAGQSIRPDNRDRQPGPMDASMLGNYRDARRENPYQAMTRTIQNRPLPHQRQPLAPGRPTKESVRGGLPGMMSGQWNDEFDRWKGIIGETLARMSPADQADPGKVTEIMRDLGRRVGAQEREREAMERHRLERDWDRDWDEDTSGNRWDPGNPGFPQAGR